MIEASGVTAYDLSTAVSPEHFFTMAHLNEQGHAAFATVLSPKVRYQFQ